MIHTFEWKHCNSSWSSNTWITIIKKRNGWKSEFMNKKKTDFCESEQSTPHPKLHRSHAALYFIFAWFLWWLQCLLRVLVIYDISHWMNKHGGNFGYFLHTKACLMEIFANLWGHLNTVDIQAIIQDASWHVCAGEAWKVCSFYCCKHIRLLDAPVFASVLILDTNAKLCSNWVLSWWL